MAGVQFEPCSPADMYAHPRQPVAMEDRAQPLPHAAQRLTGRRARSRGVVPLMWAGVLAAAAVQHAAEVDRRAGLREPTPAELAMQTRAVREIKAAWRSIGRGPSAEPATSLSRERPPVVLANAVAEPVRQEAIAAPRQQVALATEEAASRPAIAPPVTSEQQPKPGTGTAQQAAQTLQAPSKDENAARVVAPASPRGEPEETIKPAPQTGLKSQPQSEPQVKVEQARLEEPKSEQTKIEAVQEANEQRQAPRKAPEQTRKQEQQVASPNEPREHAEPVGETTPLAPSKEHEQESGRAITVAAREMDPQPVTRIATDAQESPSAVETESRAETATQQPRRLRQVRHSSGAVSQPRQIVPPGEFVVTLFFTPYGLNSRTP